MSSQTSISRPFVFVYSNHPIALATIGRILGSVRYRVMPFAQSQAHDIGGQAWGLIIDCCSVENWICATVRCKMQGGRPILIMPDRTQNQQEEIRLLHCGAQGIVPILNLEDELPRAIDYVMNGGLWFPRNTLIECAKRAEAREGPVASGFTVREEQIITFLMKGYSNKEIGEILQISNRTVKFHVSNILRKSQVSNRKGLLEDNAVEYRKRTADPPHFG